MVTVCFYELLDIIGLDEFVMFSSPIVIFPPIVALDMLVMFVSGVLMFCAFTEFRPAIANMPIMAALFCHRFPLESSDL